MKHPLLASAAWLLCWCAAAQPKAAIDSIEKLLPTQKDSTLCQSYNELTWLYRTVDRQKAIGYGEQAVALAQKTGFLKGEAQAYNDLGILYMDQLEMTRAKDMYRKSMQLRQSMNDEKGMAGLHLKLGIIYNKEGYYDSALGAGQRALALYEKLNDSFAIATALNNIGSVNSHVGNVDGALRYHTRALAIREAINDVAGMAASYVNVGNAYVLLSQFQAAIPYLEKAEAYCRAINQYEFLASALNNLGICYLSLQQFGKARPFAEEAYDIRSQLDDRRGLVNSSNVLARIYTGLKDYLAAEQVLQKALVLTDSMESNLQERVKIYEALSTTYEASGQYSKALQAERLRLKYTDSLQVTDMNARFTEMETRYQTLEKEKKIREQEFSIAKRNYWIAGIAGLLVLGGLLGFSYYKRFKLRKEKELQTRLMQQQEAATKAVMEAEENERRRIAAELHDGVGQMMSAARMNLSALESELASLSPDEKTRLEKITSMVDESCKEVRAVSHHMMPNALLKKGLAAAVREFVDKIDSRVLKVTLHTEGLNDRIEANTETMLYRVMQECINNVIKHSGAQQLDLSLINDADGLSITIEDNGKGFDVQAALAQDGIGLKNINTRIAFLKGEVEWDSQPGRGTVVSIHVPPATSISSPQL
ncbi:MAG: sensor histidine kinase [Chitinophagaceae bacterium]|nr:sensor histidine kinase [Chitinophagaceae bacterium]